MIFSKCYSNTPVRNWSQTCNTLSALGVRPVHVREDLGYLCRYSEREEVAVSSASTIATLMGICHAHILIHLHMYTLHNIANRSCPLHESARVNMGRLFQEGRIMLYEQSSRNKEPKATSARDLIYTALYQITSPAMMSVRHLWIKG